MELKGAIALLLLVLVALTSATHVKDGIISKEEDIEIEKQLKQLRKPSVKTVKTIIGDVYDCVDIRKQPALDNPLLKNHEIQMQPSSRLMDKETIQKMRTRKIIQSEDRITVDCPEGTVPIRRIGKEDLIREKLFTKSYTSNNHPLTVSEPGQHLAVMRSRSNSNESISGIGGGMSIYKHDIRPDQSSSTQIRLKRGPNSLQTGVMISPELYGDSRTRSFAFWKTSDRGCFNLHCSGFVQVDKNEPIDRAFKKTSEIGKKLEITTFRIEKDPQTRNWWIIADGNVHIGYWPVGLIPDLDQNGASYYHWGGFVTGPTNEHSAPMGSGQITPILTGYVGHVRGLQIADQSGSWISPDMDGQIEAYNEKPNCYLVQDAGSFGADIGRVFYYGGPGGYCGF